MNTDKTQFDGDRPQSAQGPTRDTASLNYAALDLDFSDSSRETAIVIAAFIILVCVLLGATLWIFFNNGELFAQ